MSHDAITPEKARAHQAEAILSLQKLGGNPDARRALAYSTGSCWGNSGC